MTRGHRRGGRLLALAMALLLGACAGIQREPAPPATSVERVTPLSLANTRYWLDADPRPLAVEWGRMAERQRAQLPPDRRGRLPPAQFLALSGGGDNGAFGAGLLVGWTQAGTRPAFDLVTGISAGALIAPFAFLGPA